MASNSSSSSGGSGSWFKVAHIPTTPTPTALLVTNISTKATRENLLDFFSFCGEVDQLELIDWKDGATGVASQRAFVQFKHEQAAHTALLLTHATVIDAPITIAPYFEDLPAYTPSEESVLTMVDSQPLFDEDIRPEDKPKQSIVAELIDRGYKLGDKIMADAEDFDRKHGLSIRFKQFVANARTRGVEFNERHQIVARGQTAFAAARSKAAALVSEIDHKYHVSVRVSEIDQKYRMSERVNEIAGQISQKANAAAEFVAEMVGVPHDEALGGDVSGDVAQQPQQRDEAVKEQPKEEGKTAAQ